MVFRVAYIEITNRCNLNCKTCYNQSGLNNTTQELSFDSICRIISRLVFEFCCKRIIFSGGEPFLHSEIERILDIPAIYPDIDFGFVTNGTINNSMIIEKLCHSKNISVQISLDGSSENVNSKTRGPGNFSKTLCFLDSLSQISDKVTIMMTISKLNCDDIANMYTFATLKSIRPHFAFIGKSGNAINDWHIKELSTADKMHIISTIETLNSQYKSNASIPLCISSCILAKPSEEYSVGIKTDGTVIPCQYLYDSSKYAIGNILRDSITEITSSVNNIKRIAIQREETDYNCTKCIINNKCHKGCMAQAEYFSHNPLGPDGQCELRVACALKNIFPNTKK